MTTVTAEVLYSPPTDALRFLPEGPYPFSPDHFSWVAIQHGPNEKSGSINIFDWSKKTNVSYQLPGRPGFAFPTDQLGVFVVGCERELGLFSIHEGSWKPFASNVDSDKTNTIINDGVTWEGNLIFGTKDLEFKTKKAGLYLWRAKDKKLIRLRDDQICSNGKAIVKSDNGQIHLIDIDSPTRQVVRYEVDLEGGKLSEPQVVVDLTSDPAVPDGMIVTPDGKSVIVSFYNPNPAPHGETRQYSIETGSLENTWITPGSPRNTCPQLVAVQGRIHLVITTAVEFMSEQERAGAPEAGSLFFAPTDFDSPSESPVFPTIAPVV